MSDSPQPSASPPSRSPPSGYKTLFYCGGFPQKLYALLTYEQVTAIEWFEDGSGFRIVDPATFEKSVITKYFKQGKLRSFFRQLNVYGFTRISDPGLISKYSFSHPLFQKNLPHLLDQMDRRKPSFSRKMMKEGEDKTGSSEESDDGLSQSSSTTPSIIISDEKPSLLAPSMTPYSLPVNTVNIRQRSPRFVDLASSSPESQFSYNTTAINSKSMVCDPDVLPEDMITSMQVEEDVPVREHGLYIDLISDIDQDMELIQQILLMESPAKMFES